MILGRQYRAAFVALLLLLLGTLVFRDFVFRDKLLLYKDIGSDSLNFHYPYFLHLSDYIRSNGLPSWSFNIGMGQSLFPYVSSLLFDPVTWLPRYAIAHALVYQHLFKLILAGIFFFKFLELRALSFHASFLGALLISLSAYMCMGSCWTSIGNEVVGFAFVLFATENTLARGRWIYLPLAVACLGLLTVFHLYLCALLLGLYVPARMFEVYGWKPLPNLRVCAQLAVIALIGVGLAAVVWLDSANAVLNSPRGSGTASYLSKLSSFPVFGLAAPLHYFTAILRQFSNDMLGIGSYFRGWSNYLEAPMSYCGLFCLLILPQVFVGAEKRQRILYVFFLAFIIVPVVFPWFRYLFWLFQGDYYRTFSLFSILGIIVLSMTAFSRYIQRGTLNLWLLGATLLFLLGILYLPIQEMRQLINPGLRKLATLVLISYVALLIIGRCSKRELVGSWIIILVCAAELCYFDRITVAYRPTVTKRELKERVGYNDYTVEAVRDIKGTDDGFYRITKLYTSGPAIHRSLNDALVFGYYGTASYSSFNNLNYIKFLIAVDAIPQNPTEAETRWASGLLGRPLLSTFGCEKYILTLNPVRFQGDLAYESIKRYDKLYAFRNNRFLPLGLFYTSYISERVFTGLPTSAKERALLHSVVLPDNDSEDAKELSQLNLDALQGPMDSIAFQDVVSAHRGAAFQINSFKQDRIQGIIKCDTTGILLFQTPFDSGWRAFVDGARVQTFKADIGLLGVKLTKGEHFAEMRYLPPFLRIGVAVTMLSLLILGVSFWRWPGISLPSPRVADKLAIAAGRHRLT